MSWVTIGDWAVLGTNSLVIKDVAPYEIVWWNPAKHIRNRFSDTQIQQLLQIQRWNRDDKKVKKYIPLLLAPDIDIFIKTAILNS